MNLSVKLKACGVTRWHIVETTRQQNLAEHQWNVAVISRELAIRSGMTTQEQNAVIAVAMEHDLHEIYSGDVPSPSKVERTLDDNKIGAIVQIADKIEALWFIETRNVSRPDVVEDCRQRLRRLYSQCDEMEQEAIMRVMKEIGVAL